MQRLRARIEGRSRYFLLRTQHGVEGMPHGTIGRPGLFVIVLLAGSRGRPGLFVIVLLAGSRSNNEISRMASHYAIVISVELPVNNGHIPHMKGFVLKLAGPFQPYTGFFFIAFVQPDGSHEFTLHQLDLTVGVRMKAAEIFGIAFCELSTRKHTANMFFCIA